MGLILCVSDRRSIPGVMTFKEAVKTARITARYDIESAPVGDFLSSIFIEYKKFLLKEKATLERFTKHIVKTLIG